MHTQAVKNLESAIGVLQHLKENKDVDNHQVLYIVLNTLKDINGEYCSLDRHKETSPLTLPEHESFYDMIHKHLTELLTLENFCEGLDVAINTLDSYLKENRNSIRGVS